LWISEPLKSAIKRATIAEELQTLHVVLASILLLTVLFAQISKNSEANFAWRFG